MEFRGLRKVPISGEVAKRVARRVVKAVQEELTEGFKADVKMELSSEPAASLSPGEVLEVASGQRDVLSLLYDKKCLTRVEVAQLCSLHKEEFPREPYRRAYSCLRALAELGAVERIALYGVDCRGCPLSAPTTSAMFRDQCELLTWVAIWVICDGYVDGHYPSSDAVIKVKKKDDEVRWGLLSVLRRHGIKAKEWRGNTIVFRWGPMGDVLVLLHEVFKVPLGFKEKLATLPPQAFVDRRRALIAAAAHLSSDGHVGKDELAWYAPSKLQRMQLLALLRWMLMVEAEADSEYATKVTVRGRGLLEALKPWFIGKLDEDAQKPP